MPTHDARTLIRSLHSALCPACGGKKKSGHSFCWSDYKDLPKELRTALWNRIGEGYEQAFDDAMLHHGIDTPTFPPEVAP